MTNGERMGAIAKREKERESSRQKWSELSPLLFHFIQNNLDNIIFKLNSASLSYDKWRKNGSVKIKIERERETLHPFLVG